MKIRNLVNASITLQVPRRGPSGMPEQPVIMQLVITDKTGTAVNATRQFPLSVLVAAAYKSRPTEQPGTNLVTIQNGALTKPGADLALTDDEVSVSELLKGMYTAMVNTLEQDGYL